MPSATPNPRRTSAVRLSQQLVTDAVVTAYIHSISERHRSDEELVGVDEAPVAGD
jgi:hypothetical protein